MFVKAIQVGITDLQGKDFNGHTLHLCLQKHDIQSFHLVRRKTSTDRLSMEVSQEPFVEGNGIYDNTVKEYLHNSGSDIFLYSLLFNRCYLEADVVHFNLYANNYLSVEHLPILSHLKPTLISVHDLSILDAKVLNYPDHDHEDQLSEDDNHVARQQHECLNLKAKKLYLRNSKFEVIVSSDWIRERIVASGLLTEHKIHVIPYGLNLSLFKPSLDNKLRETLGVPYGNSVIALDSSADVKHCFGYAKQTLGLLRQTNKNITLLSFNGQGSLTEFANDFQVIELGVVNDEKHLAKVLATADIVLNTELYDTTGISALQAMACGTPVVCFKDTITDELTEASKVGLAAEKSNIYQLKQIIDDLLANDQKLQALATASRALAESRYNKKDYEKNIIELYKTTLAKHQFDSRAQFVIDQQKLLVGNHDRSNQGGGATPHSLRHGEPSMGGKFVSDHEMHRVEHLERQLEEIKSSRTFRLGQRVANNNMMRLAYFYMLRPVYRLFTRISNF